MVEDLTAEFFSNLCPYFFTAKNAKFAQRPLIKKQNALLASFAFSLTNFAVDWVACRVAFSAVHCQANGPEK
jgi:hypothetical protein